MKETELNKYDLRIGNYINDINHFKGYFQVEEIGTGLIRTPDYILEYSEVAPIELTEEWIIKFGYKRTKGYGSVHFNEIDIYSIEKFNKCNLLFDESYYYTVEVYDGGSNKEWDYITEIKYVHHLQNLYYCLTGSELISK